VAAAASVEDSVADQHDIDFAELAVTRQSQLHGRTLAEAALTDHFGVRVIGAWFDKSFETSVSPETELTDHMRLFVAGTDDQLARLRDEVDAYVRAFTSQSILLAGYGDSGRAVAESLRHARAEVTVIDAEPHDEVDVVGDVRDPDVLRAAGIAGASALVIAVDDDTVATFATLIARGLNPELQILVRAQEETTVQNLYRAGADFVQALPVVCGRMLATTVFEDEGHPVHDQYVNVVRVSVPALEGRSLSVLDSESLANCTVLAISREGTFLTEADSDGFTFEAGDEVIVAGTDDGLQRFRDHIEEVGA
jgi:Trk K+ transport system NAD-binding subunit